MCVLLTIVFSVFAYILAPYDLLLNNLLILLVFFALYKLLYRGIRRWAHNAIDGDEYND